MSFAAKEQSRTLGAPVELYLFIIGGAAAGCVGYTNHEQEITRDEVIGGSTVSVTYTPAPITRGAISSSGGRDKSTLDITLSRSASLADRFKIHPPSAVTNVIIRSGHVGETEFIRIWGGRVLAVIRRNESEVVFSCEPRAVSMRRPGLNRRYGPGCPLLLYGPQCRADKGAATVSAVVQTVTGTLITLPPAWDTSERRPKYLGGTMEWTTGEGLIERREIVLVDADGVTLQLDAYPTGLLPDATVAVILGCDHQRTGCALHNNSQNYGGQPWIPLENPIGLRNQFS